MTSNGEVPSLGWTLDAAQHLLIRVIWDGLVTSVAEGALASDWPLWNYVEERFDDSLVKSAPPSYLDLHRREARSATVPLSTG